MTEPHDEKPDAPETLPGERAPGAATTAMPAITGPRAAAALLVLMTLFKLLLFGQISIIEPGFAIALLMAERDERIRYVRIALLLFIGWGLFLLGRSTLQTGAWLTALPGLCTLGGLGALPFVERDVPKVAVLLAIAVAGQLGLMLF